MAEKPLHNKHDNIWEIRKSGYPGEQLLKEVTQLDHTQIIDLASDRINQVGKGLIFHDVKEFIKASLRKTISLPVYKIVIPGLTHPSGAIYYIVQTDQYNYIFRGTFGYYGTGPHESALIEAAFSLRGLIFSVRDGDFLLQFSYPEEGS